MCLHDDCRHYSVEREGYVCAKKMLHGDITLGPQTQMRKSIVNGCYGGLVH